MITLQKKSAKNEWVDKGEFISGGVAWDYVTHNGEIFPTEEYRTIDSKGRVVWSN
jgi:hypothetical protein